MAIRAVHPLIQVNVTQLDPFLELLGILRLHDCAFGIEHVPLAIPLVDRAEHPAMGVEIAELRMFELLVELRRSDLVQKFKIVPFTAGGCAFRIFGPGLVALVVGRIFLLLVIHVFAIRFVVPPGVTEVGGDHVGAGMDVTGDASTRRNSAGELMLDGMPGFILWNGLVHLSAVAAISVFGILPGVNWTAVIGVNYVTGGAAAGAIISGMIIGARHGQQGVEQAGLLKAEE